MRVASCHSRFSVSMEKGQTNPFYNKVKYKPNRRGCTKAVLSMSPDLHILANALTFPQLLLQWLSYQDKKTLAPCLRWRLRS